MFNKWKESHSGNRLLLHLHQQSIASTPRFNCFRSTRTLTPSTTLSPKVDLNAKNTAKSPFAKESSRTNFREYDLAPEDELNRVLWYVTKGPDVPYPTPIHRAVFTQPQKHPPRRDASNARSS
jgi:hypothetical protein